MKLRYVRTALLIALASRGFAYCPESALAPLLFVLEYAVWRGWQQAIVYTPDLEQGCQWSIVRLMKCLGVNGVGSSLDSLTNIRIRANLGVIILLPRFRRNATENVTKLVKKLHKLKMDTSSYDWLLAARSYQDFRYVNEILNATSVRFDQNIVVAYPYSNWSSVHSMSAVEVPFPVEARNFLGEQLVVGRCNSTDDGNPSLDDDGPTAEPMLDDILRFLTVRLNTTSMIRYYSKLGFRTYEGTWTGLLGALMDDSVDLALEPVTVHATRRQDMEFIFPIAETMCNIYIRQQETSTVRDIFLAPFSARLVACVMAVALLAAITVVVISRMTATVRSKERRMGYTEALIWSTGILCQQGGTWTPSNPAASVVLIVCLFFAVVTYNAYAAFITSVLSVRVASVDTIAAVLHSPNFKIGYIRNGADQMYLMSTKDVQLNAFYIRGYSDADNLVTSAEEGLARAARQDYAFFAGQRVARSTLRSLSQARGRCAVRELPVQSTRAHLAFPLPRQSPYARPTLLSLLQLRSGGALARLEAALVPDMPKCAPPPGFASARATDVRSALILLVLGFITSLSLGLGEYCWKNRKELKLFIASCYRRLVNVVTH
ncbi:unnamed protein product [Chrysodeixis includens]|uniref:Ionotropic glutamate receptor C-terminal domain-containing protein n=1 Tax=Chrysodeixis includens TaxID=689277 RepID=A0A9N8L0P8_CHRIL|nr:unnamed protein product [Chrysodeixis includens]